MRGLTDGMKQGDGGIVTAGRRRCEQTQNACSFAFQPVDRCRLETNKTFYEIIKFSYEQEEACL